MIIKRIGVLKLAVFEAVMMAIFGFLVALFMILVGGMASSVAGHGAAGIMAGLGLLSIIVVPILYAIIGFISGLIGAAIYNLVASFTGGVEIEVEGIELGVN